MCKKKGSLTLDYFFKRQTSSKIVYEIYLSAYVMDFFLLTNPTRPIKPVPRRSIVAGSGIGAVFISTVAVSISTVKDPILLYHP